MNAAEQFADQSSRHTSTPTLAEHTAVSDG